MIKPVKTKKAESKKSENKENKSTNPVDFFSPAKTAEKPKPTKRASVTDNGELPATKKQKLDKPKVTTPPKPKIEQVTTPPKVSIFWI